MTSIRARLLASMLALFALVAAAMGLVTYRNALVQTEALFDYQLQQMALSLRDQGEIPREQIDTLTDAQLDFVVQVWTADGRAIYASRPHVALPSRTVLGLATLRVQGRDWRSYAVATPYRVVQVAQPVEIRERLAARTAWRTVWPLLLLAPLAAFVLAWGVTRSLAPLRAFAAELRTRDADSLAPLPLDARARAALPTELAPLAAALGALLARLAQALDAQRAFIADAAHELRSPFTALKLQLEVLRRSTDEADRAAAREALATGIERGSRLVEQLLALARTEPGAMPAVRERVDLAVIARTVAADLHPIAATRGVELAVDAEAPVVVDGDPLALQLLVRNLVDNAVRHAPSGSTVPVRVERATTAEPATLSVDDAGPGIPAAERARVFDRFYRRAPAQAAEGAGGSGLGLAIVARVAASHGARVDLDASPLGGLRAVVRFGSQAVA